jgi:hypothetical protein
MFAECFGFGYSDLRDRLSDYLPVAVKAPIRIIPRNRPPFTRTEVKPATPAQIARLRGEWERLEISFVRERHPQFVSRYIEQARNNLRRAVGNGQRDPQLLATLGLCEIDAGDPSAALPWLESAAAANIVRPRVYFEIARLRWEALTRGVPETRGFTTLELEPVLAPLRRAAAQAPLLPEVVLSLEDAWLRCREPALPSDMPFLIDAARRFRRLPGVGFRLALLHLRHGQHAEALETVTVAEQFVTDPESRQRYRGLRDYLVAKQEKR